MIQKFYFQGICIKESENTDSKRHAPSFSRALFTIAKMGNNLCLCTDDKEDATDTQTHTHDHQP